MKIRILLLALFMWLMPFVSEAQSADTSTTSYPKLEIVLGVILIIFAWLMYYLIRLDAKVTLLEKSKKEEK
jgi:protein-S-isoprenylcysteine O-methyltransferase Ste14